MCVACLLAPLLPSLGLYVPLVPADLQSGSAGFMNYTETVTFNLYFDVTVCPTHFSDLLECRKHS